VTSSTFYCLDSRSGRKLVRADSVVGAFELLRAGQADVSALPRSNLLPYVRQLNGSRVLADRLGVNSVAIAVPKGHAGRLACIREFIEEAKRSGLVQRAIENAGLRRVQVAPALEGR
jgi:polar amino acid transport system substrate-binding protein